MKKFIVTISEGWNGLHFEFSKQDDAELTFYESRISC